MAENDFYQICHRNKSTAQTVTMKRKTIKIFKNMQNNGIHYALQVKK